MDISGVVFDDKGLVPAIIEDESGQVLMLAWMNAESLRLTLETGLCHYYSRSRKALWKKGETSGHIQTVRSIRTDCDGDCLLVRVAQQGAACHTGEYSCFHNVLLPGAEGSSADSRVLQAVYGVILDRREHPKDGSYTNYLFDKGLDKICKKIGEEAAEVIIAAKNRDPGEVRYEAADLLYHLMVALAEQGVPLADVYREMAKRHAPKPQAGTAEA